jgi:thiamine pyrophosphokinase
MVWILQNGGRAWLIDRETRVTVLGPGQFMIPKDFEGTVSLFSLGDCLEDVTIRGMKYEVEHAVVRNDYPVGCSNETLPRGEGRSGLFSIGKGTGLLVLTRGLLNKGDAAPCGSEL